LLVKRGLGPEAMGVLEEAYEEMGDRRFEVYEGLLRLFCRRTVTDELAEWVSLAAQGEGMEVRWGLVGLMVFPFLVLSGLSPKAGDGLARQSVERRLRAWRNGGFADLLKEARERLPRKSGEKRGRWGRAPEEAEGAEEVRWVRKVAATVRQGKLSAANSMVGGRAAGEGGVLECTEEVKKCLEDLHPTPRGQVKDFGRRPTPPPPAAGVFEAVTGDMVRMMVVRLRGAAGPSGLTAEHLKGLCRGAGVESSRLCEGIASLTRRLGSTNVEGEMLTPLLSARLVPLDKGGGSVRPIGIGEIWRRLCGKLALRVVRKRVQEVCGCLQVGAGFEGGCEAAVHAAQRAWELEDVEAMVLVDARNAFNKLDRERALTEIEGRDNILGPLFRNFYPGRTPLWLPDGSRMWSEEGTTQGCPLGMPMFAMGTGFAGEGAEGGGETAMVCR
jgi:hypothetical protein